MKKPGVAKHSCVIALGILFAGESLFGQCYYIRQYPDRCRPSIQASCDNSCYQEFSFPAYGTYCNWEEASSCGKQECDNEQVPVTMSFKYGACYPAGEGPMPQHTECYCYSPGTWQEYQSGTCSKGVLKGGQCGICG